MALGPKALGNHANEDVYADKVTVLLNMEGPSGNTSTWINAGPGAYSVIPGVGSNNLTALDSSQAKFGSTSMAGAGTASQNSSYTTFTGATYTRTLQFAKESFSVGTGDFTVEMWVYPLTSTGRDQYMFWSECVGSSQNSASPVFGTRPFASVMQATTRSWQVILVDTFYTSNLTLTANTWQHLAICRASGVVSFYKDGTKSATTVNTAKSQANLTPVYAGSVNRIGSDNNQGQCWAGWVDDFRLTVGVARYTATFTAPTLPFIL